MKTDIMIDFQVCIIVPLIAPQSIDYSPPDFSISQQTQVLEKVSFRIPAADLSPN